MVNLSHAPVARCRSIEAASDTKANAASAEAADTPPYRSEQRLAAQVGPRDKEPQDHRTHPSPRRSPETIEVSIRFFRRAMQATLACPKPRELSLWPPSP